MAVIGSGPVGWIDYLGVRIGSVSKADGDGCVWLWPMAIGGVAGRGRAATPVKPR
jgi:hypothetical protein